MQEFEETLSSMAYVPYPVLFPRSKKGAASVFVGSKFRKVKPGDYLFLELYCAAENCDCREVVLLVINDQQKQLAVIAFPLDIDLPFNVPRLHEEIKQPAVANDLLEIFTDTIVAEPDWYRLMCQNYRAVRKKIDQKPYEGGRFPNSSHLELLGGGLNEDDDVDEEAFFKELSKLFEGQMKPEKKKSGKSKTPKPVQANLFEELEKESPLSELIRDYCGRSSSRFDLAEMQDTRLRNLLTRESAVSELVAELVESYQDEDVRRLEAVSQMTRDVLEILRTDMERRRPDAAAVMHHLQTALARQVFQPGIDPGLGAEITRMLLDARVEILPQLHEANKKRMAEVPVSEDLHDFDPEEEFERILEGFEETGVESPFELVDMLLQMMAVGDQDAQIELYSRLFFTSLEIAREAAALMVSHPQAEVREAVAEVLAQADGSRFSPIMLRRLIVSRNWFPEAIRKKLDQAISNARRARVECAPLANPVKVQIYASTMDGANAQSFMAILPRGKGFSGCSIMLKKQQGVADAFILLLEDKGHLRELKRMMLKETGSTEIARGYLNLRICQGLADGATADKVPTHWLVAIAEALGNDQWKAVALDCEQQLQEFKDELEKKKRVTALKANRQKALQASLQWPKRFSFAMSWFEDDVEVDQLLKTFFSKKASKKSGDPVILVADRILEARRRGWLERLVISTLWLKHALEPPVPWEQMYHVAAAVADDSVPLNQIPLMRSIADKSIGAFLGRNQESL